MQSAPAKFRKLETAESLAMLHERLTDSRLSDVSEASIANSHHRTNGPDDSLSVRVAIKRGRLVLLTALILVLVLAVTLCFSRGGVVIDSFERSAVSIADQEKLLEKYNSYSGTITGLIERPVEAYMALAMPVVVLRVMAGDALIMAPRWRMAVAAAGAGGTYLMANAFSAVNVQVRELPVQSVILAGELDAKTADPATISTMDQSFAETQSANPPTNTILRNLLLPRAIESRGTCPDRDSIDALDGVDYRIPQLPWMKHLLPQALDPTKTMKVDIAAKNTPANTALTPDQFPMNASVAADLLVLSYTDSHAWGISGQRYNASVARQFFRTDDDKTYPLYGPTARLTNLLPPKLGTSEREDREWFLKNAGPTLFASPSADSNYTNASLRSWTMKLARVDIVPGAVWVDAITVERHTAPPRLATSMSKDGKTSYFALSRYARALSPNHVAILKAGSWAASNEDGVDLFSVCTDREGYETLTSSMGTDSNDSPMVECPKPSNRSLFLRSRGKRLVADALIENATISTNTSELVHGSGDDYNGVVVNLREVFSTTLMRITWDVQNLSQLLNARCDANGGCLGFDIPLPGSPGQHLVVNASTLPVALAPPPVDSMKRGTQPLELVSVRRPKSFSAFRRTAENEYIGDVLMPHNIRNMTVRPTPASECDSTARSRLVEYVNNHVYMETTLQATYTAAVFFLFQNGVVRDIVNQSTTSQTMLAFDGNVQDMDVYVYIPWLNVVLTFAGCALLVVTIAIVVLWPSVRKSDPLERITGPHAIANVMLNESVYPSMLLTRAVADAGETVSRDSADKFVIQSLSLRREGDIKAF